MQKVAVIGAGISGLGAAHFLKDRYDITVYEKECQPGGLIKCRRVDGSLFHTCGGHIFNSKRQDVLDWFWSVFSREEEFSKADRNSCVFLDRRDSSSEYDSIPYPIENHVYLLDKETQKNFYKDLDEIDKVKGNHTGFTDYGSFGDFLLWRFGRTLYEKYFRPYNEKVWRRNLTTVPMSWMEGKLPMPTTREMRDNNAYHIKEKSFVHSSFWYEKLNGSQYIADKLANRLDIRYGVSVDVLEFVTGSGRWRVCGEEYDKVIFCGNVKDLVGMVYGIDVSEFCLPIETLEYHGTTAVFCEIDKNPYSWIYMPSEKHKSHRIICTGNFSALNNAVVTVPKNRITATVEFTDEISKEEILDNLKRIPLHPKYLDHQYHKYTYPIQNAGTRELIKKLKMRLAPTGLFFTGRFADWEYYNMDVAIGAAMDLCKSLE